MWAEILEAQVFAQIKQEGMFQKQVGKKLVTSIL
ncbi:MAG: hypothetical protein H6767_07880 [Candidatus Peribacteria bacterium]|nr:MAG: hypothetical protein H6767_07880 [Candidatus Peribacteria bacterium]